MAFSGLSKEELDALDKEVAALAKRAKHAVYPTWREVVSITRSIENIGKSVSDEAMTAYEAFWILRVFSFLVWHKKTCDDLGRKSKLLRCDPKAPGESSHYDAAVDFLKLDQELKKVEKPTIQHFLTAMLDAKGFDKQDRLSDEDVDMLIWKYIDYVNEDEE